MKTTFNVNVELIALSLTFHMLPLAVLSLFSGSLSDIYYRPKILMYGLFVSSIGSLLAAVSPTIHLFLLSRSIQGIGSALIMPIVLALIGDIIPTEALGKAMGISGMIVGFGGVTLGPLISGFLGGIEWRLMPLLLCVYAITIGVLSRIILKGLVTSQKKGNISTLLQQIRQTAGNRNIALLSAAGYVSLFTFQGMMPLISDVFSLPPLSLEKSQLGILFSIVGFIGICSSFFSGFVADKIGGKRSMLLGFLLMLLPMFLLTFSNSYWFYLISLSALSSFNRLTFTSRSVLAVELTPETRGTASSIVQSAQFLGFATAPVILTWIYSTAGVNSIYLLNLGLLLVCAGLTVLLRAGYVKKIATAS